MHFEGVNAYEYRPEESSIPNCVTLTGLISTLDFSSAAAGVT